MLSQHVSELESQLNEITATLDELVSCLREEREAIVEYDLDRINQSLVTKHAVVLNLQRLDHARRESAKLIAADLGMPGAPSTGFVISRIPDSEKSRQLGDRMSCIRSLAQVVSEFNDLQQQLLDESLNQTSKSLDLIMGLRGQGINQGYDSKGTLAAAYRVSTTVMNTCV